MPKAQVTIYAKNDMQQGLKGAESALGQFQKYTQQISDKIKSSLSIAAVGTAIIATLRKVTQTAKECVNAFTEADKVSRRLAAVWDNVGQATGKTAKQMDTLAESLEKETYFTSESIKEAGLLLAATESLSADGFDRALEASMDLAAALREDVTSAAQTLAKAIQEPESALSRLKTIGVSFTEEEKQQIKALTDANKQYEAQELLLSKIEQRYQGVAKAITDTPSGKLDAIKDTLQDIRETFGQGIINSLAPAFDWILKVLQKIQNWASAHVEDKEFYNMLEGGSSAKDLASRFSADRLSEALAEQQASYRNILSSFTGTDWGSALASKNVSLANIVTRSDGEVRALFERYFGKSESTNQLIQSALEDMNETFRPVISWQKTLQDAIRIQEDMFSLPAASSAVAEAGTSIADAVEDVLSESVEEAISSPLADFLKSYQNTSESYQLKTYQGIIDKANEFYEQISTGSMANVQELFREAGIDPATTTRSDVLNILSDIIANFTQKIDELTALPEEIAEEIAEEIVSIIDIPGTEGLKDILNQYGKQSASYTLDGLKDSYNRVATFYGERFELLTEQQRGYLKEILAGIETEISDQEKSMETEETVLGLIARIQSDLTDKISQMFGATSEQAGSFIGSVVNQFTSSMGQAGEVASTLVQNMATMGPLLGAIATALKYVFEGLSQTFGPILNDFVAYGIEPLRELGRAIGTILTPLLEEIMPLVEESGRILCGIFNTLGVVLQPIISFIATALTPIIQQLTISLELLEPLLKVIGGVLITISTAFQWVADWIRYAFASVANWLADIEVFGYHPFEGLRADAQRPKSYQDMWQENWDKMNAGYEAGYLADAVATQQAVSSAAYRGATSVTINIYAEGPIVGDGGMRQFASMIRDEFEALDYYGVN